MAKGSCNAIVGAGAPSLLRAKTLGRPDLGVLDAAAAAYLGREGLPVVDLQHPVILYLASLRPLSRRTQINSLRLVVQTLGAPHERVADVDWPALGRDVVRLQMLHTRLAEERHPVTANKAIYATRSVLRACVRLRQLSRDDYDSACDTLRVVQSTRVRRGRSLEAAEIEKLFAFVRSRGGAIGARDAAMLALLFGAALRRSECSRLDLASYDPIASTIQVIGKGDRERVVPLPEGTILALEDWITVRGRSAGPLLWSLTHYHWRGGARRLSSSAIYSITTKLARDAGVANLAPHDFRRTYIGDLLDEGVDPFTIKDLVGHQSVNTTAGYDRRPARVRAEAVKKLRVPYEPT